MRDARLALANVLHIPARERLHSLHALEDMRVHSGLEYRLDSRQQIADEGRASRHPLHPVTAVAVVWPVEGTAWEEALHPAKQRVVPHMHSDDDLRAPSVESEVAFADQQADNDAPLQVVEIVHLAGSKHGDPTPPSGQGVPHVLARKSCEIT
jgi:hypothetical protein